MDPVKYPRTPHLPGSPGMTDDDRLLEDSSVLESNEVVVTEKMDGECTSIYTNHIHARSIDGLPHPSQSWVRHLARQIGYLIPPDMRVCGESLYAAHSIEYTALPSYFLVFGIYEGSRCLSWDETLEWSELLGLQTVPVLYRGAWNLERIKACYTSKSMYGALQEGYVVRTACSFPYEQFHKHVAKWVRANHVTTNSHWKHQSIRPNRLASGMTNPFTSSDPKA